MKYLVCFPDSELGNMLWAIVSINYKMGLKIIKPDSTYSLMKNAQ